MVKRIRSSKSLPIIGSLVLALLLTFLVLSAPAIAEEAMGPEDAVSVEAVGEGTDSELGELQAQPSDAVDEVTQGEPAAAEQGPSEEGGAETSDLPEEWASKTVPPKLLVPFEDGDTRIEFFEVKPSQHQGAGGSDGSALVLSAGASSVTFDAPQESVRAMLIYHLGNYTGEEVDISRFGLTEDDFDAVVSEVRDTYYELSQSFMGAYIRSGYTYKNGTWYVESFQPIGYADLTSINTMRYEYAKAMADVLSWVPANASVAHKAKAVHDWFTYNVRYDYETYNGSAAASGHGYSAYGALVLKSSVCNGYMLAYREALRKLDIPCATAVAHNHGWNLVKVGDYWYHVDTTWDAPSTRVPMDSEYFLKSDQKVAAIDLMHRNYFNEDGSVEITHSEYVASSEFDGVATDTRYDNYWNSDWPSYTKPDPSNTATALSLSKSTVTMTTNAEYKLSVASVTPSNINKNMAVWSSADPTIAYVASDGTIASGGKLGTTTVTCEIGNVKRTCQVRVVRDISLAVAKISPAKNTYTGSAVKPTVAMTYDGDKLVEGADYTLSFSNNVNVGTAAVTITGKGNYAGTASGTFQITAADISKAKVTAANQTYNGSAKKPAPTVELGGKTLASGTDYSVSYANNTNAGTATVTVTGKGNYAGKASGTFKINPASLAKATVTAANQTYTGSARKPAPTVELGGKTLASADYDVSYADNVNAGTATVTVTGKGNYKGTASGTFTVAQRAISAASIADIADQPYVGSAVKPKPELAYGGKALKEGADYTLSYKANTAVGTATVTVAGKGNFKGTASKTFEIVKADLSKAAVAPIADQTYSGSAKKPAPKASFGSLELKEGTDYTVAYSKNTDAGTATVTLAGKGNFAGKKTATFKIKPASIAKASVAAKDQTYTGSALKPAPTVTLGNKTLASTDYDVSYAGNVNAGTATVTVTGKGNYSGTASGAFKVNPASIAKATVTAPDQEWTGKPVAPAPAVKLGSRTLKAGTDYKVTSYSDNVDAGTAKVTVQGKGNYKGTATGTFEIVDAVPVYRLYNRKTSEHLYTLNKNEYDQLPKITKGDWVQEGIAWYAPKTSKSPVYRLYNKRSGDHHYTTDQHERKTLIEKYGWTSEGIAFYSDDAKRLPLYRVYNSRLQRGQHHYTADANERKALTTQHGWVDEGIGFYGVRAK